MKDQNEVIQDFNKYVNMTATELEKWLKSGDSQSAGWPKGDEDGESVGHDSGRKIVEILKANSKKDPDKYTEDQVGHMRKVASYCKRHLAQEEKANSGKSAEELKKTKSYASLKNWGHDALKARGDGGEDSETEEDVQDEKPGENQKGEKRKATTGSSGANKKRETRQGASSTNGDAGEGNKGEDEEQDDDDEEEDDDEGDEDNDEGNEGKRSTQTSEKKKGNKANGTGENGGKEGNGKAEASDDSSKKGPNKGDTVSWNWGGGNPKGKVLEVKDEETSITTKRGNEVTRKGEPDDPAVVLDAGKSKAIKLNHELN